jgi:hypothetical protein
MEARGQGVSVDHLNSQGLKELLTSATINHIAIDRVQLEVSVILHVDKDVTCSYKVLEAAEQLRPILGFVDVLQDDPLCP